MMQDEMPLGLGMALAQNPEAMRKFFALSETDKRKVIEGTHRISSKEEMRQYAAHIASM